MAQAPKSLDPDKLVRSPGLTYQQLLDQDTRPVPEVLRMQSPRDFGSADVSTARYTSKAWHELEVERLWKRVWQMACREEDIPAPGDHLRYDIAGMSFLVVRTEAGALKAYPNACLHRDRILKEFDGRASELRCAFHGFCWHLDGRLKDVPARWDFPQIEDKKFSLPELPLATWAGFVFINPDRGCAPFSEHIKDLADQFQRWDLGKLFKQAHVAKVMPANWKIAQEAFSEAFYVNGTHPQISRGIGDVNSQVDVWDNCARVITPSLTPSPLLDYTLFPNFHPWGAFNRIVYRFRPNGNDHRSSIMECVMLAPFSGERPPATPIRWLREDEPWGSALGFLGRVFDQDASTCRRCSRGSSRRTSPA